MRALVALAMGVAFLVAANLPERAHAAESVTYCYDSLGRLSQVARSGGPLNGQNTSTGYDPSGNRTNQSTAPATADCSVVTSGGGTGGGGTGGGGSGGGTGPSFSVGDAQGTEGDTLTFTVTKTGAASTSYSVSYATAIGTAGTGDFTAVSGILAFAASETSKTVLVATKSDLKAEGRETFYLNLSSPTGGATISDGQGVGSIDNDDSLCTTC